MPASERAQGHPTICITVEADYNFEVCDLWPDGDEPEEITADAVRELMERQGGKERVLHDWMMTSALDVDIVVYRPNPAYGGDRVLFGKPPAPFITDRARAWDRTRRAVLPKDKEPES